MCIATCFEHRVNFHTPLIHTGAKHTLFCPTCPTYKHAPIVVAKVAASSQTIETKKRDDWVTHHFQTVKT